MNRVVVSDLSGPCGQTIARYFLDKGVAVAGLRCENLPADLAKVEAFDFDATTAKGCEDFAAALGSSVDALILTGRQLEKSSVLAGPMDVFDRAMAYNTKAAFFLSKYVGNILRANGKGAIVYIASMHDEKPNGAAYAFSASMGAMKMLHREATLQMGRDGAHCILIEMGPVEGDEVVMDTPTSPIYDGFELSIPRRRACTFEELAPVVEMAINTPMLNGAEIRADAGFMFKYGDR